MAIIGAGPAGLMAAEVAAQGGAHVTVYDAMPSVGRKFLMAGRGGLNLTHSEPLPAFPARYGTAMPRLAAAITAFPPDDLRNWSEALGQPTFVGSSGRVFPAAFKASPLLRAWLRRLDAIGVQFAPRHRWTGWDIGGRLMFSTPGGPRIVTAQAMVLALGGASRPRLGSDGRLVESAAAKEVSISPHRPANSGFTVAGSDIFLQPLRRPAAQGCRAVVWFTRAARRGHDHAHGYRGRRNLSVTRPRPPLASARAPGPAAARQRAPGLAGLRQRAPGPPGIWTLAPSPRSRSTPGTGCTARAPRRPGTCPSPCISGPAARRCRPAVPPRCG